MNFNFNGLQPTSVSEENIDVAYSEAFLNALAEGKPVLRRIYTSRSNDRQITFQFLQRKGVKQKTNGNVLVAMSQGIKDAGYNKVSASIAFEKNHALSIGAIVGGYYCNLDKAITADDIYGIKTKIEVTESFEPHPKEQNPEPQCHPVTKVPVMDFNPATGELAPVYRHTEIRPLNTVQDQFIADFIKAKVEGMPCRNFEKSMEATLAKEAYVKNGVKGIGIRLSESPKAEKPEFKGEGFNLNKGKDEETPGFEK